MFLRIMRHEWRVLAADSVIWILTSIFAVAIGYGLWNGTRWVGFQRRAIAEAEEEERKRYAAVEADIRRINETRAPVSAFADPRNPDTAGRRLAGRYAILPPAPLAALSIGQSDLLPYYFRMTTDAKENVLALAELENPSRLLAGRFDLAFVVIYLYPLLILALCYGLLSAEREQGTLALALSQPVRLRTLVLAKVGTRAALFLAIVVGFAALASIVAGLAFSGATAIRFLLWTIVVAAYGAFWFALSIAVVARGRSSSTNAMILAGCWLVLVVLLPSLFNLTAMTLYPVPSRVEMVQAVREASDEANSEGAKLLGRYYQDHPELAADSSPERAMSDFNVIRLAVGDEVERRVRPVMDEFERRLSLQQQVIDRLRFLSPAILAQDAINDIAGTGVARHRHFVRQVEAYHQVWRDYFLRMVVRKVQLDSYAHNPRFVLHDEPLAPVVQRTLTTTGGVLLPSLVIAVVGLLNLRRYSVVGSE
jgi:ABC-2 type transport system permease protein